jgi:hypothetical protein
MIRFRTPWVSVLSLLLLPNSGFAQTAEIQREVEARLWYERFLLWIEATTGLQPAVALGAMIALVLSLLVLLWWYARRK